MVNSFVTSRKEFEIQAKELYSKTFFDLLFEAHPVHRKHHDLSDFQQCTLLSIKIGGSSEDCTYCPQSAHYKTGLQREPLLSLEEVKTATRPNPLPIEDHLMLQHFAQGSSA